MNTIEQKRLMSDMDGCAYSLAGFLLALVRLHDEGTITLPIPDAAIKRMRPEIDRFRELHATYNYDTLLEKLQGKDG